MALFWAIYYIYILRLLKQDRIIFHWSLSDCKFSKIFRTSLDILANFNGALVWMVLFTNPSARAGYDTRSIFKRSLTGLKSEFSFS